MKEHEDGWVSSPSKSWGTNKTVKETAWKHARKHEARPARIMSEFRLDSNGFGFICDGVSHVDGYV